LMPNANAGSDGTTADSVAQILYEQHAASLEHTADRPIRAIANCARLPTVNCAARRL
jgi:hypothetical protein